MTEPRFCQKRFNKLGLKTNAIWQPYLQQVILSRRLNMVKKNTLQTLVSVNVNNPIWAGESAQTHHKYMYVFIVIVNFTLYTF